MNLYSISGELLYKNKHDNFEDSYRKACKGWKFLDSLRVSYKTVNNLDFERLSYPFFYNTILNNCNLLGLSKCTFKNTILNNCILNYNCHKQLSYILYKEAGNNIACQMVAGYILINEDKCWKKFLRNRHPKRRWALETLAKYTREGDNSPEILKRYKKTSKSN